MDDFGDDLLPASFFDLDYYEDGDDLPDEDDLPEPATSSRPHMENVLRAYGLVVLEAVRKKVDERAAGWRSSPGDRMEAAQRVHTLDDVIRDIDALKAKLERSKG